MFWKINGVLWFEKRICDVSLLWMLRERGANLLYEFLPTLKYYLSYRWGNFEKNLVVLWNMFQFFFFYFFHEWKQIWQNFLSQKFGKLKCSEKVKSLLCYQCKRFFNVHSRNLNKRIYEHKKDFKNGNTTNCIVSQNILNLIWVQSDYQFTIYCYLSKATFANFRNNGKIWICVLIKHYFLMWKNSVQAKQWLDKYYSEFSSS